MSSLSASAKILTINSISEFLLACLGDVALPKRSTLKGKNLILKEQILPFTSWPLLRREAKTKLTEFLPLKIYLLVFDSEFTNSNGNIFIACRCTVFNQSYEILL